MDENILPKHKKQTVADDKAAIAEMMEEMQRLNQQVRSDQAQIERLNAETAMLKVETRDLLARMGTPV